MENSNNYNEIQKNINLYLDQAMNDEDQKKMMDQMKGNPDFPQMINKERNFRTFLKNNVKRYSVSSDLIQSIINQIKMD
jgi:hypothetical protein